MNIIRLFLIYCFVSILSIPAQATEVDVVEMKDYTFSGDSFFDQRKDESFTEQAAPEKFVDWATEAIGKVNKFLPKEAEVARVKIKLVFFATIKSSKQNLKVPISNIESYQEPKTNSIRLGMLELQDNKESFQLTVAHEYAHLVFENVARSSGVVSKDSDNIEFWAKSIYEGTADYLMAIAFETNRTASVSDWSVRRLDKFKTLADARAASNNTVAKASNFFQSQNLVPQFLIYSDWLEKVGKFIQISGKVDPYVEGSWVVSSMLRLGTSSSIKSKVVSHLLKVARTGAKYQDPQEFVDGVLKAVAAHNTR